MRDCILEFQAVCHTNYGEEVRIAGNHMELGNWDLSKSLVLTTDKHLYPTWRCSKKIRLRQGNLLFRKNFTFQFKVWIAEHGQIKRWENYPDKQNRSYTSYLKRQTLIIMVDQSGLRNVQKVEHQESKEFVVADPVRKFDENDLKDDDERSSSSLDYFDNLKVFEDFSPQPTFNLDYIANAYREIISRFQISEAKIENKYGEGRLVTMAKNIIHVAKQKEVGMVNRETLIHVELEVDQNFIGNSGTVAAHVMQHMTLAECFILHSLGMCLALKMIRKNLSSNNNYKIGLFINDLEDLERIRAHIHQKDIIQCLILTNILLFPSFQVMNQLMDLLEAFEIVISLQFHSIGNYTLNVYDRPILLKVIPPQQEFTLTNIEFLSIHPESVIKKRIQNIKSTQSEYKYAKVIIFSFGVYENFSIIKNNKDSINQLCETHQVCVFTPNKLSEHRQIIGLFPKILFISYTFLEMEYLKVRKSIDNLFAFSEEFRESVSWLVRQYPGCTEELTNNHLFVRNTDRSRIGISGFQSLSAEIEKLINDTNRSVSSKQNRSLNLIKINSSTLMIRQAFQTQLFFTKVILQTIESRIDFIILFVFNRFQNFKFLQQLKAVAAQKSFNAAVMAYTLGYVKNRHCYNINSSQFAQILAHLQKCSQKPIKSPQGKRFSIGYLG